VPVTLRRHVLRGNLSTITDRCQTTLSINTAPRGRMVQTSSEAFQTRATVRVREEKAGS
jgi:hypothetical protein